MVGFTRVVGSTAPAPDGAKVEVTEYAHRGPPVADTRAIAAREGMVIHAAEVRGKMWNDHGRHASCNVKLCPAAGSTRDKVVITSKTSSALFAGDTLITWKATVTFVPEITRPPSPPHPSLRVQRKAESPSYYDDGGVQEPTNSEFYTKLRVSMGLSMLCYAGNDDLEAWREGGINGIKIAVPLDEVVPVHLALAGEDAESGTHRTAQWLMATADGVLYVAFKGTSTLKDALLDTQLRSIKLDSGVRLHSGFNTGVNDELEMILAKCNAEREHIERVVFTGHSLGGAYAIAALLKLFGGRDSSWLPCEAITFGAPLVVVSPTLGGSAELPPDVPPILNVVEGYDIVPRLLAMTDGQVDSFMKRAPTLDTFSMLQGMAELSELPAAESFTQELNELRRCYRPVGTFVFAQSFTESNTRFLNATVVPSDDAAGLLKQFPDVKREAHQLAFAQLWVVNHFPAGYWRIVKALCEAKDQVFASFAAEPRAELSGGDERPCDWKLPERAVVNRLDTRITVTARQHSFDVASGGVVSLTLKPGTRLTVSSSLLGDTKWNIAVPTSGGLLIQKSNLLGYVARTYSLTDDGWEMGPIVSPHNVAGGYVDELAAHLDRRYPAGATVGGVSSDEPGFTSFRQNMTLALLLSRSFSSSSVARHESPSPCDDSGVQKPTNSNSDFYTKLRLSMRLSMLCYAEDKVLTAWRKCYRKKEVPLTDCTSFKPDEVEPVHLALEGEDAESGTHRMAQWLMAKADGVLYVAFKGTSTISDALLDTQLRSIKLDSGVRLHSGFNTGVNDEVEMILAKCKEERSNVQRVVLTGHSLGGAYAIAALLKLFGGRDSSWLPCEAITFGAPLVVVSPPSEVPPILNVVANYDIVPRLLAMTDGQVDGFMTHIPDLITNGSWLKGMAFQFVLPEAKRFTRELNDLRRRYQPVGTFVFAQSHVEGRMRRTSATVVPSDDAAGVLTEFPDVQQTGWSSVATDEFAFAKACVAEHSPTGYWRIVKALCEGKDQAFASCVEKPSKELSGTDERPCDEDLPECAVVNRLDARITVTAQQHSFDVASKRAVDLTLRPGTKMTVSSTLFGETRSGTSTCQVGVF